MENSPHILIITEEGPAGEALAAGLAEKGYACSIARDAEDVISRIKGPMPALVLLATSNHARLGEIIREMKTRRSLPVIVLAARATLADADGSLDMADDFITWPGDQQELILRVARLLRKTSQAATNETMRGGALAIDLARCEVTVAGRPIELTFREYELLKFLVSNKGRVFTRDALLNKVWGYDYYGGDRTVDVHIRRLRSKIESPTHHFIETVRNIGYRFLDN